MPKFKDRVKDTTTTTGTGSVNLSGTAPSGFQTFATAFPVGDSDAFGYCITGGSEWETGVGYLSASATLVRMEVFDGSSGAFTLVNFSAGSKDVFCTAPAHWLMDSNYGALSARVAGLAMP